MDSCALLCGGRGVYGRTRSGHAHEDLAYPEREEIIPERGVSSLWREQWSP